MTPEDVLSHPPRALSQAQREFCFENGYLAVERFASFSTPALPPTPFPYAASRSVVALWPGGAWEARPLGAPRPVPLPHSSTLVRRLHFHIRCPDRRGQGRAGSEFMEKTMRKRFESPPGPDSPRRDRGAGVRFGRYCVIATLAMLLAGCTGLVPGLPI